MQEQASGLAMTENVIFNLSQWGVMIKEKVEKIKEGEKKAEEVIKEAENRATEILAGLQKKVEKLKREKEEWLKKEIGKFREGVEKDKNQTMKESEEENKKIISKLKGKVKKNLKITNESAWGKIQEKIF